MKNSGQVYQVKNCRVCSRKLEPQQAYGICLLCYCIEAGLDDYIASEEGLFFVLNALGRRVANVDVQQPGTKVDGQPGGVMPTAPKILDSAWLRAV